MLTIGDKFPAYSVTAVVNVGSSMAFQPTTNESSKGKWKVYFFYPKDFTFVCPIEHSGFNKLLPEFESRNCKVYGASTDNPYVHVAWRGSKEHLKDLNYPLISDQTRELSQNLGIIDRVEGVCLRATFIVDPDETIRYVAVNDLGVGRSPEEVLRVLDGLQNGGLIPCNWNKGDETLSDPIKEIA